LVNQIVTGVLLAMYYSPSVPTAWASVAYVQDQVTLGWAPEHGFALNAKQDAHAGSQDQADDSGAV